MTRLADARDGEAGSAAVVLLGVVLAALLGVVALGGALRTQLDAVRAATVADDAAIGAAAATVGLVDGAPCAVASVVALASDARATGCAVVGTTVTVRVVVASGLLTVGATARAGPDTGGGAVAARHRRDIQEEWTSGWASAHRVYGVPVGQPRSDTIGPGAVSRPWTVCTIDQGVTCQARRSS